MLKALAELTVDTSFELNVIGGGVKLNHYKQFAMNLSLLDRVKFIGALPNTEVVPYLQRASIAIFPFVIAEDGDQEGLGLTMVEAMGCECLVLAADLPAVRDVIAHGDTGLLFESGDYLQLASLLQEALDNIDTSNDICRRARALALEKFDWETVAHRYYLILSEIIDAKP